MEEQKCCKKFLYRIYPNKKQQHYLSLQFAAARIAYNKTLEITERHYHKYGENVKTNVKVTDIALQEPWIRKADSRATGGALRHLVQAYQQHYKKPFRVHLPKRKKFYSLRETYEARECHIIDNSFVQLPKLKTLIRIKFHRPLPSHSELGHVTIIHYFKGPYLISINVTYPSTEIPNQSGNRTVGLDFSLSHLYVTSDGLVGKPFGDPDKLVPKMQRVKKALQHSVKGSSHFERHLKRLATLHRRFNNQKKAYLRQLATQFAADYDHVFVEDLDLMQMYRKGFKAWRRKIMMGSYALFLKYLDEAMHKQGHSITKVSRWFPSTKTCSKCGHIQTVPLSARVYKCPECGLVMDRDTNAAINIQQEGLRLIAVPESIREQTGPLPF